MLQVLTYENAFYDTEWKIIRPCNRGIIIVMDQ